MPHMNIQVPPNLSPNHYSTYIEAGINDWGGISPLTIDFVNPESPWPDIKEVKPWFSLNSPKGGFKRKTKTQYSQKGILGENDELIDLIRRMI